MTPTTLTSVLPLHRPVLWRLLDAAGAALVRWGQAVRLAAQRRVERRAARFQHALLAHLDAQTLRDIGQGDWAAAARASDDANYRRALELRGF